MSSSSSYSVLLLLLLLPLPVRGLTCQERVQQYRLPRVVKFLSRYQSAMCTVCCESWALVEVGGHDWVR